MCLEQIRHLKRLHNAQNSFRNSPWKLLSELQAHKCIYYIFPSIMAGITPLRVPWNAIEIQR
jgi:hypothetical protein